MAKLLDFITVAAARAAIIWLIGEYNQRVPTIAPDVLRKVAKSFPDESNTVKLQALNLAVKLYLTNPEQTTLLSQYIFNLAKYDQNYDIRDRARFLRQFVFPDSGKETILSRNAKKIFLATKPAPALESKHCGREKYQLGSLSHLLNMRATGYQDLPVFPEVAPDPTLRNIELPMQEQNTRRAEPLLVQDEKSHKSSKSGREKTNKDKDEKKFYSEEDSSVYTEDSESSSSSSSSGEGSSGSESSDGEEEQQQKKEMNNIEKKLEKIKVTVEKKKKGEVNGGTSSSSSSSSGEDSSSSDGTSSSGSSEDDSSSSEDEEDKKPVNKKREVTKNGGKSNLDLLLDLDAPPEATTMTPSLGGFLSPMATTGTAQQPAIDLVAAKFVSTEQMELLSKASCYGLEATYRFTRAPNLFSPKMTSIEVVLMNHNENTEIGNVQVGQKTLPAGMQMKEFACILTIAPKAKITTAIGVDFNDSCQAVSFEITSSCGMGRVSLKPPVGELMRAVVVSEAMFRAERNKLRGMTEHSVKMPIKEAAEINKVILKVANVAPIEGSEDGVLQFAGQTMSSKSLVLITVVVLEEMQITVNCEKMVVGSLLLNDIKSALQ